MNDTLSPPGLTLTQARRVVWPFNRKRGLAGRTIGELLDGGDLARRDLEWAAANARNLGLQNACRTILSDAQLAHAPLEIPGVVLEDDTPEWEPAVALIRERSDIHPASPRPVRWQNLIPPDFAPQTQREAPQPEPIPPACPICGSAVKIDYRWSTRKRAGWRCAETGLAHFFEQVYLPMFKVVYSPEFWVIPPSQDGAYPGVRRSDLVTGSMSYWPTANA